MTNKIDISMFSKLGMRGSLGLTLFKMASDIENLVVITADLCGTSGLDRFKKEYPNKFYNVGIAEQNMIGIASGLAKEGYIVFVTTFSNFAAMRCYEQIRLNMGYMKFPIKVVGMSSGFSMGMFGNTHYGTEDISLMRSIPNMTVISPADSFELSKILKEIAYDNKPVYLRLSGVMNNPIVYNQNYDLEIGRSIELKSGKDAAIIATGSMVYNSLEAAKLLEKKGISVSVINMHTIKPIDSCMLDNLCFKYENIFTVEEHSIIGGLGSSVSEYIVKLKCRPSLNIIGVKDCFEKAGDYEYMLDVHKLTPYGISDVIEKTLYKIII